MAKKNIYREKLEVLERMFRRESDRAAERECDEQAEIWYLAADWCKRAIKIPEDPEDLEQLMYWD